MKKFSLLLAVLLVLTFVFGVSCDGSTSEPPAAESVDLGTDAFNIPELFRGEYSGQLGNYTGTMTIEQSDITVMANGQDYSDYVLGPLEQYTILKQTTAGNTYHVEMTATNGVTVFKTVLDATLSGSELKVTLTSDAVEGGTFTFTKLS